MGAKLSAELEFPASPKVVWAMLTDAGYLEFKRATVGDFELEIHQHDGQTQLTFTRPVAAEMPAAASALLGASPQIVEIQDWNAADAAGNREAQITISIAQAPAKVGGTAKLSASPNGTQILISLSIEVSIPLFGNTAENLIKKELEKHIHAEQTLGLDWLAKQ